MPDGFVSQINDSHDTCLQFYYKYWNETTAPSVNNYTFTDSEDDVLEGLTISCDELIRICSQAANKEKFMKLYKGDISAYNDDRSNADLAFASILAFYTDDINTIRSVFQKSGLWRDKLNREDYFNRTVGKAVASVNKSREAHEASLPTTCSYVILQTASLDVTSLPELQNNTSTTDVSVLDACRKGKDKAKFKSLYEGNYSDQTKSEADIELCYQFATHTKNINQIVKLFQGSALYDADSDHYLYTIAEKAIDQVNSNPYS